MSLKITFDNDALVFYGFHGRRMWGEHLKCSCRSTFDIFLSLISHLVSYVAYDKRIPYFHTSSQSETNGPVNFCWPWVCVSEMFARATMWVLRTCLNIFIGYAHSNCLRFKGRPTTIRATTNTITSTIIETTTKKSTKTSTNIWKFKFGIEKKKDAFMYFL